MGDLIMIKNALEAFTPGAAGVWTLVIMVGAYLLREWRETRKLSAEDRLARRDGYAAQLTMVIDENRKLRADLMSLEKRHDDYRKVCQEETTSLQRQIITLESEIQQLRGVVQSHETAALKRAGAR